MASSSGGSVDTIKNLGDLPSESFRMAMAVVTMGPIVLAYPFFQKYFVKGLTIGAVKG
jgi:putative aldouronate transport system permease protein